MRGNSVVLLAGLVVSSLNDLLKLFNIPIAGSYKIIGEGLLVVYEIAVVKCHSPNGIIVRKVHVAEELKASSVNLDTIHSVGKPPGLIEVKIFFIVIYGQICTERNYTDLELYSVENHVVFKVVRRCE